MCFFFEKNDLIFFQKTRSLASSIVKFWLHSIYFFYSSCLLILFFFFLCARRIKYFPKLVVRVAPTSKKNFSENSLVLMLYIWHSGCFMKPTHKRYFWPFLYPKIAFFVIFAQICPKNMIFLNGRHNFFCICRLAKLKIYVRGLLLYFQKNKQFLKLANFSGTYTPLKIENPEKKIFFRVFDFEGCTGPTEVGQLQKLFIFLKV